jgi:acyl-coenzyme A thioesterase PaaI-like protein
MFKLLEKYLEKAKKSNFYKWYLGKLMNRGIPFNLPHKFRFEKISDDGIVTFAPYIRKNMNHLKGIHAMCIATVAEFSAGMSLLNKVSAAKYRLIMANISIDYKYQAKSGVYAKTEVSNEFLTENLVKPLEISEKTLIKVPTKITDTDGNHIADVYTEWQVKEWAKVKTKL